MFTLYQFGHFDWRLSDVAKYSNNDQEDCKCKVVSLFLQVYMNTLLKDTPGVNTIQHLYAHTKHTHTHKVFMCMFAPRT